MYIVLLLPPDTIHTGGMHIEGIKGTHAEITRKPALIKLIKAAPKLIK